MKTSNFFEFIKLARFLSFWKLKWRRRQRRRIRVSSNRYMNKYFMRWGLWWICHFDVKSPSLMKYERRNVQFRWKFSTTTTTTKSNWIQWFVRRTSLHLIGLTWKCKRLRKRKMLTKLYIYLVSIKWVKMRYTAFRYILQDASIWEIIHLNVSDNFELTGTKSCLLSKMRCTWMFAILIELKLKTKNIFRNYSKRTE